MVLPRAKILVVDDERNVLLTVVAILEQEGYDVDSAGDGKSAIDAIRTRQYDLVLTDLKMPGVDGLAVLEAVRNTSPNTVTVMMTGYGSVDTALEAVQRGAYEYLLKPTEVVDLKAAVRRSLERKRLSEIDTLYRISRTVTTTLDADKIATEVTEAVRRVLGIANATLVSFVGPGAEPSNGARELLRDTAMLARLQTGEILTEQDKERAATVWAECHGVLSYAIVPGVANGQLICALCADNGEHPYEFHASALRFLRSLAGQASLALSNAAMFAELQKNNEQLATMNNKLRELDKLKRSEEHTSELQSHVNLVCRLLL